MKVHSDTPEPDVRIEIVPLIDVIFCILTFFILAAVTLTRQSALNVDLPQASTGSTQMREMLIVSVDPVGQTYIEQKPVTRDELFQSMQQYREGSPEGLVVLYASRSASYNDVVEVLDLLKQAGGDRVALATLPGSGDANSGDNPAPNEIPAGELPFPTEPLPSGAEPFQLPGLDAPAPGSDAPSGGQTEGRSGQTVPAPASP